jgi:hypothetical protein
MKSLTSCGVQIDALNTSADPTLCDACFELVAGLVVERMERGEAIAFIQQADANGR